MTLSVAREHLVELALLFNRIIEVLRLGSVYVQNKIFVVQDDQTLLHFRKSSAELSLHFSGQTGLRLEHRAIQNK